MMPNDLRADLASPSRLASWFELSGFANNCQWLLIRRYGPMDGSRLENTGAKRSKNINDQSCVVTSDDYNTSPT